MILFDITEAISELLRPHSDHITIGLVATLLVLFGDDIVKFVKAQIRSLHFIPRLLILVTLSALGFTAITNLGNSLVADLLNSLPDRWFSVAVISAFFAVGIIAEKKRFM